MSSDTVGSSPVRPSTSDAVLVLDENGRVVEATRLACDLTGYSREDLLARSLRDLSPTSEAVEADRLLSTLEEASISFDTGLRVKDGSAQLFHLRLSKVSVAGRRHSIVQVARRRRAADKLPDDPDFVRALLDASGSILLVLDAQGRIAFFNKACETESGYRFADIRGRRIWEFTPEGPDHERVRSVFAELDRGTFPARIDHDWTTRTGQTIRLSWSSTLLLRADGSVRFVIGTGLHVTGGRSGELRRQKSAPGIHSERSLVEEAVREADSRFRTFAENAEDLLYRFRVSPDPVFEYLSPVIRRLTGYDAEDYYRDPELGLKVVHPGDRHCFEEMLTTGVVPDQPMTLRWIRKDGAEVWLEQRNVAVRDPSGRLVAIEGIARDVTVRCRRERCLDASYSVSRILSERTSLQESAPRILQSLQRCFDWDVGNLWLLDPAANVLRLSALWHPSGVEMPEFEELCRSTSFRPGEGLPGRVWLQREPMWISDVAESELARGLAASRAGLRAALGVPIIMGAEVVGVLDFFSADVLPPDDDILKALSAIGTQIGQFIERRQAEQRQSAQYGVTRILSDAETFDGAAPRILEQVCQSLGWEVGAVWLVERETQVLRMNVLWRGPSFEASEFDAVVHRSAIPRGANLVGRVWEGAKPLWIHDLASHPEFALGPAASQHGLHGCFAFPILLGEEVLGVLEFLSRDIRQPDPQVLAMIGSVGSQIGQFIERKAVEAEVRRLNEGLERRVEERTGQLEEAIREMASFTYTIAHDLRAPLRSMSGFAQAMVDDYGAGMDPTCLDYAHRVAGSARKMDALIVDLLSYGRLIHLEVHLEAVKLDSVVTTAVDKMASTLRVRDVDLEIVSPLGTVRGNRTMLDQVFSNLLSNAVKFVAPGVRPRIRIQSERRGVRLCTWIEDNGIGIAPEFQDRIFGIFQRLNREEDYPGTGIGLAIVRKALERMGGRAGVDSVIGRGSRFWIELPAV